MKLDFPGLDYRLQSD